VGVGEIMMTMIGTKDDRKAVEKELKEKAKDVPHDQPQTINQFAKRVTIQAKSTRKMPSILRRWMAVSGLCLCGQKECVMKNTVWHLGSTSLTCLRMVQLAAARASAAAA